MTVRELIEILQDMEKSYGSDTEVILDFNDIQDGLHDIYDVTYGINKTEPECIIIE